MTFDDYYAGGHKDGVSDALATLHRLRDQKPDAGITEAINMVRLSDAGWTICPSCQGDQTNHAPTTADVAMALAVTLGARPNRSPFRCKVCHGEGLIPPPKVTT